MMHRIARRWLGLPAPRCASDVDYAAVEMPDGVRLSTTHVWPIGCDGPTPTLLIRTPYGVTTRPPLMIWLGRLFAEYGYHVVIQDVRGRYASEGHFEPFVHEAADGAATIDWLDDRGWCQGPIGLFGASYLAHSAWAAASRRPERVGALAIAIGSSDLHPLFYPHGVFSFANAVEWAAGVGEREGVAAKEIDLDRALRFEPVREADRVARCEVDFYRTWVDHPEHDEYWQSVRAPLPDPAPPTLFVAGWWDFFLEPQLEDHARLCAQAAAGRGERPELVLGPWSHGPVAHRRFFRNGMPRRTLGRIIRHFDHHLARRPVAGAHAPVRFFVCDPGGRGDWRDSDTWPPADGHALALHLHPAGSSGELTLEPPEESVRIEIEYDPSDPTPSVGGAFFGLKAGSKDQREVSLRDDVACLESLELREDLVIAGPVALQLFVSSEQRPADFAAHLVDLAPDGSMLEVGDGLARLGETAEAMETGEHAIHPLPVSLGHRAWRFRAGHRVRLHLAPAHCPRFGRARPPGPDDDEAPDRSRQWIHAGPDGPSRLELVAVAGSRFDDARDVSRSDPRATRFAAGDRVEGAGVTPATSSDLDGPEMEKGLAS